MSKHTPGPWFVVEIGSNGADVPRGCELVIDDREGGNEARDYFLASAVHGDPDELLANARLIAAAPELLAEIERQYTELADYRNEWPGRSTSAGQAKLICMRHLIAKATGRSERDVQDDYGTRAAREAA